MLLEKRILRLKIPLADLPEHPAHRLVNQIVLMAQKELRKLERLCEVPLPDEVEGGHHRDALPPEVPRMGQLPQDTSVLVVDVSSQHFVRGSIHQIPVVHIVRIGQIELHYLPALPFLPGLFKLQHQHGQGREAAFMHGILK